MDKEAISIIEKVIYTSGIVTAFWKSTDAFFSYLHKRQRGYISEVVKEDIKEELAPLRHAIEQIRQDREKDQRFQTQQFQQIQSTLSDMRKKP